MKSMKKIDKLKSLH